MNVLHLDEQRGWRGGEQQASWLIQGLARHGHHITIVGRPGEAFISDTHGDAVERRIPLALRNEFDLLSARKLAKCIKTFAIDIVHAHTSHAHMLACLGRMMAGTGKVVVSRRVSFEPKKTRLNRWKYGLPDRFLSVSKKVDEVLADYGLPETQRRVVHSSLNSERINVAAISREEIDVPQEATLLLSAGALVGHKDHKTLLSAMPDVIQKYPDVRLLIAGEGELRVPIERQIDELGLADSVTLLGQRSDVPALMRASDVYVSSSWSEGLGTSVLESLACETPTVATVAGGVPEMVIDGETGYLVENRNPKVLAEAILKSLGDREAAKRMAQRGREHVESTFGVERMVEGTLRAYEELLAE